METIMFSEQIITQMAAYLLKKRGGRMAYLKLIKLLYLAERKAVAKWGEPISGDHFVSMPHGPVLSQTYELIKSQSSPDEVSPWHDLIEEESYEVFLSKNIEDFDELSQAEMRILDEVYAEYGTMGRFQIRDFTHDHCQEWEDPHGSAFPIRLESILRAMGRNEEQVKVLKQLNQEQQYLDQIKATLR
jgi:uncharacterized phage-associated protein